MLVQDKVGLTFSNLIMLFTLPCVIEFVSVGIQEVDIFNIPPIVEQCLKNEQGIELRGDINPFYISGDFDGDDRLDYAAQVREVSSRKRGILICQTSLKRPLRIGAGKRFIWNDDLRFNAWYLLSKREGSKIIGKTLKGDVIFLQVKEAANGIAYWDGKNFTWKQMDD